MTKKRKTIAVSALIIIVLTIGVTLFVANQDSGKPTQRYIKDWGSPSVWEQHKQNDTVVSPQEKPSQGKVVTIDFAKCSRGGDSFGFGMGSTNFYFEGSTGGKCRFYMGTEIENPRWDGHLNYECNVPIDYKKDFTVGNGGADLTFADKYCTK